MAKFTLDAQIGSARAAWKASLSSPSSFMAQSTASRRSPFSRPSCRSEEHTTELQSLMRITYAGFGLTKTTYTEKTTDETETMTVAPAISDTHRTQNKQRKVQPLS